MQAQLSKPAVREACKKALGAFELEQQDLTESIEPGVHVEGLDKIAVRNKLRVVGEFLDLCEACNAATIMVGAQEFAIIKEWFKKDG
jgi:hypothetical protein